MGALGIITICVTAASIATSVGLHVANKKATEARMKREETRTKQRVSRASRRSLLQAMSQAAIGSTSMRIRQAEAEKKLADQEKTGGRSGYRVATQQAQDVRQERIDEQRNTVPLRTQRNYGRTAA